MSNVAMHLLSPIFGLYKSWSAWHDSHVRTKKQKKAYAIEIAKCKTADVTLYTTMVDNQYAYTFNTPSIANHTDDMRMFLFKVGCAVARHILPLRHIVGIQTLTKPVGLIFQLQMEVGADYAHKLVVGRFPTVATSTLFQTKLNLETHQDFEVVLGPNGQETLIESLSLDLANEIIAKVITDLNVLGKNSRLTAPTATTATYDEIHSRCYRIARDTYRTAGDFIAIMSHAAVEELQRTCPVYEPRAADEITGDRSLQYVGNLSRDVKVMASRFVTDEVIVGRRNSSDADVGYVYSPYVLVTGSGVVMDPETFAPRIQLLTRSAKWTSDVDENFKGANTSDKYYHTFVPKKDSIPELTPTDTQ